jgi:SAM-dependent methyltransferase
MTQTVAANLYDYPHYYDLVFGSDWQAERDFLIACFQKHARRPVRRVFEPACGTGRLLYRLGLAGYDVSGLDLNERAVEYCNQRLRRNGFPRAAFVSDMSDFRLTHKVDAAFNMINSFRHLADEQSARAHLSCVARALGKGGLYVLGLHLTPMQGEPLEEELWSARRGHLCINTRLWRIVRSLRRRQERFGMSLDVYTPTNSFQIVDEIMFRTYTADQIHELLAETATLEIAAVYDFSYDPNKPISVGPATEDAVYVLRKR